MLCCIDEILLELLAFGNCDPSAQTIQAKPPSQVLDKSIDFHIRAIALIFIWDAGHVSDYNPVSDVLSTVTY